MKYNEELADDLYDACKDAIDNGADLEEVAQTISQVASSYDRLATTIDVMDDPRVQDALEEGAQEAFEMALKVSQEDDG